MQRRNAVSRNRLLMLARAIALVALEAVPGERGALRDHDSVARHFGDDRGRRNRQTLGIALDHGARGNRQAWRTISIDQRKARALAIGCENVPRRLSHRPHGCIENILTVDPLDISNANTDPARRHDGCINSFALVGVERLQSAIPPGIRAGSRMTAAATTGPAQGPRPASSIPMTGPITECHLVRFKFERRLHGEPLRNVPLLLPPQITRQIIPVGADGVSLPQSAPETHQH